MMPQSKSSRLQAWETLGVVVTCLPECATC